MTDRRSFLVSAGAFGTFSAVSLCGCAFKRAGRKPVARFGMVTDIHYADIPPDPKRHTIIGRRFYRESRFKLDEAVAVFNRRDLDFAIELGDFKDFTRNRSETLACLDEIETSFSAFKGPRYHVLGNHDFDCLTEADLFSRLVNDRELMSSGHYTFMVNGITFVVLDACYDSNLDHYSENNPWDDANVPPEELIWLEQVLRDAEGPAVVFCHQRLDPFADRRHLVRNAQAVRTVIERSRRVKAVITGHQHNGAVNEYKGIAYYSLRALVCEMGEGSNSFAETEVFADGSIAVTGWQRALSCAAGTGPT